MRVRRLWGSAVWGPVILCGCLMLAPATAQENASDGLVDPWMFAIGEWDLVETRYSFEGELIQTNIGTAVFSYAMNGERLQEYQKLLREGQESTALHLFVYDPRSEEIEIVRRSIESTGGP